MAGFDVENLKRAINMLYSVWTRDGQRINLAAAHVGGIAETIQEFLGQHKEYNFAGAAHQASGRSDLVVDQPRPTFWIADSSTAAWGCPVSTAYTDTDMFPTTSSVAIRLDTSPPLWEYLFGFLDVGSKNNIVLIDFASINSDERAVMSPLYQSRVSGMKVIEMDPAIVFKDRGTKNINAQFEEAGNAKDVQVLPLAVEILPFEIATAQDVSGYISTV